jgi:DNA-binding NarL/FixJ family response regulator
MEGGPLTMNENWPLGVGDPVIVTTRITILAAAAVILSAAILGYTALFDLFVSIGLFWWPLAIFFPLLFDLAEITAAVTVFNAKLQGEEDRFAWIMVLLFTGLGIAANVGHAVFAWWLGKITTPQVILAVFATSLFPLSVALVTHLVKRVIAQDISRRGLVKTLAELTQQSDQARADLARVLSQKQEAVDTKQSELDRLNGQIDQAGVKLEQTRGELEQVRNELKAAHFQQKIPQIEEMNAARLIKIEQRRTEVLNLASRGMSPQDIAAELKVSLSTVKRDLTALNGTVKTAQIGGTFERIMNTAHEDGRDDVADILTTTRRGWDRVNGKWAEGEATG